MTREEAIRIIKEELCYIRCGNDYNMDECKANCEFMEAVEVLEQEPKWIPVSERLPKYNTPVLLALKQIGKERAIVIGERRTRKSGWYFVDIAAYDMEHEVMAWMPLPEPYKAESEGK